MMEPCVGRCRRRTRGVEPPRPGAGDDATDDWSKIRNRLGPLAVAERCAARLAVPTITVGTRTVTYIGPDPEHDPAYGAASGCQHVESGRQSGGANPATQKGAGTTRPIADSKPVQSATPERDRIGPNAASRAGFYPGRLCCR